MAEPVEISPDLKEKTLSIAMNSGLGSLIEDISDSNNLIDNDSKLLMPVPVSMLEDFEKPLEIDPEVKESLRNYQSRINSQETAKEYPYLITGNISEKGTVKMEKLNPLHEDEERFKNDILKMSTYDKKLVSEINEAKKRNDSLFILGHTHPLPNQETKEKSLLKEIQEDKKEKYNIKDLGLNLTLRDLHQLVYFMQGVKGYVPSSSKIFISVLTYDGNFHVVGLEDDKFKKVSVDLNI